MQRTSSGVLIGIVLIFLVCNSPRFVVKTFIIATHGKGLEEQFLFCDRHDQLHVPVFVHIIGMFPIFIVTRTVCFNTKIKKVLKLDDHLSFKIFYFRNGQSSSSSAKLVNQLLDSMLRCKKISKNSLENSSLIIKRNCL